MTNLNTLSNLIPQTAKGRDFITSIRPEDSHGKPASINVESKESSFSGNRIVWHVQKLRGDNNTKVREDFVKALFDNDDISDIKQTFSKEYKIVLELIGTDNKKPLDVESARNAILYKQGKLTGLKLTGKAAEIGDKILTENIMKGGVIQLRGQDVGNPVVGTKLETTLERVALLKVNVARDDMIQRGDDKGVDWNERAHEEIEKLHEKVGEAINSSKPVLEGFANSLVEQLQLGREKLKAPKQDVPQEPEPRREGGRLDALNEEFEQVMKAKGKWFGIDKVPQAKPKTIESELWEVVGNKVSTVQTETAEDVSEQIESILNTPNLDDKTKLNMIDQVIGQIEYKHQPTVEDQNFVQYMQQNHRDRYDN